jgi:HEAT repeat protein
VADPTQPQVAVARSTTRLYRSTNGGRSWESLANLPGQPTALALGRQTANLIYLGTSTGGAFRSTDGGRTWTRLSVSLGPETVPMLEVSALAVAAENDAIVYAASGNWSGTTTMHFDPYGIFVSVDGGMTWLPLHRAELHESRVTSLAVDTESTLAVLATNAEGTQRYSYTGTALLDEWLVQGESVQRIAAARVWSMLGGEVARQHLLARLLVEPDAATGQAIAHALGSIAKPNTIHALVAALSHADPQVRWRAATVLGYIPTHDSIIALRRTLQTDDSIARSAASQALIHIGTPEAAQTVVPLLADKSLSPARHIAMATLEGMEETAVEPLLVTLAGNSPVLRQNSAETLGYIASPQAVTGLTAALKDADESVRQQAAWALNEIGTPDAMKALAAYSQGSPAFNPIAWLAARPVWTLWVIGLVLMLAALAVIFFGGGRSRLLPRR